MGINSDNAGDMHPEHRKVCSFFDFDGTLIAGDSFTGFIRHAFGLTGLIRVLLMSSIAILLWKTGLRSNVYAKLRMFSAAFKGMPHAEFRKLGRTYISCIDRILRPEVAARLLHALERNETVAIVSASLGDWIRPWAAANGVSHVIATEPEVDAEGRLTGRFSTPNCEKKQKVVRLLEAFPDLGSNRSDYYVTAYGDSPADSEFLAFADNGINIKIHS